MARFTLGLMLAFALGFPAVAEAATEVRVGLGADYRFERDGVFELTLGVGARVARFLEVGGRFGALVTSSGPNAGLPLDLQVRANLGGKAYLEGLAGPWFFFSGDTVRTHLAFGFGLQSGALSVGLEVGYLQPNPIVGLRLGVSI